METTSKPFFTSKTMLVNAIVVAVSFFPSVSAWVTAHPTETMTGVAAINMLLRIITKGKITLFAE